MAKTNFYWIEIIYLMKGEEKMFSFMNCTAQQVQQIRATILQQGLQVPIELAAWAVVFPAQISSFTYYRQEKFFNNMHSDLKKTVFDGEEKTIS